MSKPKEFCSSASKIRSGLTTKSVFQLYYMFPILGALPAFVKFVFVGIIIHVNFVQAKT